MIPIKYQAVSRPTKIQGEKIDEEAHPVILARTRSGRFFCYSDCGSVLAQDAHGRSVSNLPAPVSTFTRPTPLIFHWPALRGLPCTPSSPLPPHPQLSHNL